MKRLSLIGSWKRLGVQLGLLAGIGLAFVGGTEPPALEAAPANCTGEEMCSFQKPLFMLIVDYSTSMNTVFDKMDPDPLTNTRWAGAKKAITAAIASDNGYLASNMILGLTRFGHDPTPGVAGTTIPNDNSGIVDGQKLDVPWYNAAGPDKGYVHCDNGDAINDFLASVPAPINGNLIGIGTWTKGALDFTKAYIAKANADHPEDKNTRLAVNMVITDGEWTNAQGNAKLSPAGENPALTATDLFNQGTPTYVVAIGEAQGKAFANELAAAGGTVAAIDAVDNAALVLALKAVIADIQKNVVAPVCTPGLPRIMVLLDASSSMLNVANKHAGPGQGGWEQARQALAGDMGSIFDVKVNNDANPVEDVVHLGLAVFGFNAPAEEKLIVQYGPCRKDNFAWALDPKTSCGAGCNDPYGAPPIKWTFLDGQANNPPGFDEKTISHMPKCDFAPGPQGEACVGSGTYVHLGLNLVQANIATYKNECKVDGYLYPCSDATEYVNILVTDGDYNSSDAQVQAPLQAMFNNKITTYVIGFGDLVNVPASLVKLNNMAKWGSGNANPEAFKAENQAQLEAALKGIIEGLTFDPCCKFNDCSFNPEPNTVEPDPVPVEDPDTGTGTTDVGTTDGTSSTGEPVDTDPGTGTTVDPTNGPTTDTTVDPTNVTDPGTTTNDPTNPPTTTDPDPTDPDPTNPTATATATATAGETSDSDTDTDTETDSQTSGTGDDDEGCGCKVEDNNTRGLLGTLLALGMGGFLRRRRRA